MVAGSSPPSVALYALQGLHSSPATKAARINLQGIRTDVMTNLLSLAFSRRGKLLQIRFEETKVVIPGSPHPSQPKNTEPKQVAAETDGQGYHIEVKGTNEVIIALLHPSTVVIKAQWAACLDFP
ncbi:hypothetical protein AK812_SmicGene5597 [Symbiodinium microadriaticum]|uniref:Uncharacterized protein n=1 Tax=Symbiodinium microadriaticum TaxID=2951 RepID=A0A1Q9ETD0_SYMMI|nr:hypothetical protein AK812_SmicGene5597 [Symbiodinium microadriaticum]